MTKQASKELKRDAEKQPVKNQPMMQTKSRNKLPCLRFEIENEELKLKDDPNRRNDFGEKLSEMTGIDNAELAIKTADIARLSLIQGNNAYRYNTILHSMREQKSTDLHEARLSAQAAVLYEQGMVYLSRAEGALDDGVFDKQGWSQIFMKHATKLLDLHTKTIEAINRYRQRGEQKIIVQHLNIDNGSQAIVNNGNMVAGGGGKQNNVEVPHDS
jgi:hypothetical protein